MKCVSCGFEIEEKDLKLQPQKDREGNIKTNKHGDTLMYKFHTACWEFKEEEKGKKDKLNDYLLKHFFNLSAPHSMWISLINIRNCGNKINLEKKKHQGFSYDIMLESLQKVEDELLPLYRNMQEQNKFADDEHRSNLIIKFMMKNADNIFLEKKANVEKNETQTKTNNFNFLDTPELKSEESPENYDILE